VPNFAAWGKNLVDGALSAANTSASQVGYDALNQAGVVYRGIELLNGGAILIGLLWAAIAVFSIDRKWKEGIIYALIGAVLSFFGIIHSSQIMVAGAWQAAIGYVIIAAIFALMIVLKVGPAEHQVSMEEQFTVGE